VIPARRIPRATVDANMNFMAKIQKDWKDSTRREIRE
jgi:hypothetical protein